MRCAIELGFSLKSEWFLLKTPSILRIFRLPPHPRHTSIPPEATSHPPYRLATTQNQTTPNPARQQRLPDLDLTGWSVPLFDVSETLSPTDGVAPSIDTNATLPLVVARESSDFNLKATTQSPILEVGRNGRLDVRVEFAG